MPVLLTPKRFNTSGMNGEWYGQNDRFQISTSIRRMGETFRYWKTPQGPPVQRPVFVRLRFTPLDKLHVLGMGQDG